MDVGERTALHGKKIGLQLLSEFKNHVRLDCLQQPELQFAMHSSGYMKRQTPSSIQGCCECDGLLIW